MTHWGNGEMYPYRLFLSYSSEDRPIADSLQKILVSMGLSVVWDRELVWGNPFTEEIKDLIARSHLFVPLLTESSRNKPWVHQETGYAMGLGVPILPVAVGEAYPDAMIGALQAFRMSADDIAALPTRLTESFLETRVTARYPYEPEHYILVDSPERRTEQIARFASKALGLGGGRLRVRGAMSSFSLPMSKPVREDASDPFKLRDGRRVRSHHMHKLLWQERTLLGTIAKQFGCTLLLAPDIRLEANGDQALLIRQRELSRFLGDETLKDLLPIVRDESVIGNALIVGDWFYAESKVPTPGSGYEQTLFTWHAPTVLEKIRGFDEEFDEVATRRSLPTERLRATAIANLQRIIERTEARIADASSGSL
jgi:hypothetical protein